jgi:RNA polymerase sigma factor (sigma-70 family)
MIEAESGQTLVERATDAFTRFQGGERHAFDQLVETLTPLMWRTVRGAGVDPVAAEDVVQTVWLNLFHHADALREPRTVTKWVLTSTRREAWRVSGRSRDEQKRSAAVFGVDDEELMDVPAQPSSAPDEAVLHDDRQRVLWRHVQSLPERCRQLISVIAFADRPDYSGLAEALGMPVGSIGPTRGRCLGKLRDRLGRDPHWEGQLS